MASSVAHVTWVPICTHEMPSCMCTYYKYSVIITCIWSGQLDLFPLLFAVLRFTWMRKGLATLAAFLVCYRMPQCGKCG